MSNDKLKQLGIPRRSFLTKAAAATFAAPVVVSFGLDNVAEASPGMIGNQPRPVQCFSNQPGQSIANQFESGAENLFLSMLRLILSSVTPIRNGTEARDLLIATDLAETLLRAMLQAASGQELVCQTLATFQNQVQAVSNQLGDVAGELLSDAEEVASRLGCVCVTR